jgi:hypothetical protein
MSIKDKAQRPWSAVLGLLSGAGVAVMGVYRDLDPDVILFRAVASGVACGLTVLIARLTIRLFQS